MSLLSQGLHQKVRLTICKEGTPTSLDVTKICVLIVFAEMPCNVTKAHIMPIPRCCNAVDEHVSTVQLQKHDALETHNARDAGSEACNVPIP